MVVPGKPPQPLKEHQLVGSGVRGLLRDQTAWVERARELLGSPDRLPETSRTRSHP